MTFWRKVRLAGIGAGVAVQMFLISAPLRMNYTDSEPVGLYWVTREPAALAQICLGPETERLLPTRYKGACPGGYAPLLKRLYRATPEHPIVFSASGFAVDGIVLRNTAPLASSAAPAHIPFGAYTHGLFAISTHHPRSFDSRYFGAIPELAIVGYARPLFVLG